MSMSDSGCDEYQQGKNKYTLLKSSQCLIWLFALSLTAVTLACTAVCLQCKNSNVFCSHCATKNEVSYCASDWRFIESWTHAEVAQQPHMIQVWETDRWQECKHLHVSLQLREGFKVWVFVLRGLRLLFEVWCLANFNNCFGLSQYLNQSPFVLTGTVPCSIFKNLGNILLTDLL